MKKADRELDFVFIAIYLKVVRANPERSRFPVREEGQVAWLESPNGLSASKTLKESHLLVNTTLVYQASSYTPMPLGSQFRQRNSQQMRIAAANSSNAIRFLSARTTKRFPSSHFRCGAGWSGTGREARFCSPQGNDKVIYPTAMTRFATLIIAVSFCSNAAAAPLGRVESRCE
jgi:hypothetical protein